MKMDIEDVIRLFRKQLFEAYYDWIEINKEAIGEKRRENLIKKGREASDCDTAIKIMGTALWMFNMIGGLGVLAGIGPSKVNLQHIDERLDEKSTKRLLHLIAACISLQHLPRDIATKEIALISPKKFSLKLWLNQNQP